MSAGIAALPPPAENMPTKRRIVVLGVGRGDWRCARCACVALFWLVEDFLWFVLNPAWGVSRFGPEFIPWHKHWIWFAPMEYLLFAPVSVWLSWRSPPQSCLRTSARKGLPT